MIRVALALLLLASSAHAQTWRTFAGGFSSRWNTTGHHGHDQEPCDLPDCDADDFARANLDDSIGFRAGIERDLFTSGALRITSGAEASVSHTEYNLSQRDFSLVGASLFAGADLDVRGIRAGARLGFGGYATSTAEHTGTQRYLELGVTIPLRDGAAVRIARRTFTLDRMNASQSRDISVAFVTHDSRSSESPWEFLAVTGTAMPGAGAGGDRKLRSTALNRTSLLRAAMGTLQLEVSWTSTAHESSLPSVFRGYDGNYRSKTIESYGLGLTRTHSLSRALALRWSGGIEVADWRDEHRLLTRDGRELVAGVEVAMAAAAAVRMQLNPRLALETSLQKVYWQSIDLGELRWTAGIVLTR